MPLEKLNQILQEINYQLNNLKNDIDNLNSLLTKIKLLKKEFVYNGQQDIAKALWCRQTIVSIYIEYNEVFQLFRQNEFYQAWCKLERIEISLRGLKKHLDYSENQCNLLSISKSVYNLQILFPYSLFASHESIYREIKCNICDQIISPLKPCEHKVGEIYNGEICVRIITKADLLAIAIVDNPVNKYAVLFFGDEKIDRYDYSALEYFSKLITSPNMEWDLEIEHRILPHDQFYDINPEDDCPCGSPKTYQQCCLNNTGVKHIHYSIMYKPNNDLFEN